MASKRRPKDIGTEEETYMVEQYRHAGFKVSRASNNLASWDITVQHLPFPVEVKVRRASMDIPGWVRDLKIAADINEKWFDGPHGLWLLHVKQGDMRKKEALGRITVMPNELYFDLLKKAYRPLT